MSYYVDERVGCIAVRDKSFDDEWSTGLHQDMDGVVAFWSGMCNADSDGGWIIEDWKIQKANSLCELLNTLPTSNTDS